MKLATSFSPTRTEAQEKATLSWERYNLPIVAVQCYGEDYAKHFTNNIHWVKPNLHWSKRTPAIVDILQVVDEPTIFLNSDIELDIDLDDWQPEPDVLTIGLRTDYCPKFIQLNKYGIDVFLLTPEMKEALTNNIWALGIPGWDYWVVWKLIESGYDLKIIKEDIKHAAHHEQWNKDDYRRCAKLLEFEFDIPITDLSDKLQEITGRTHLSKKVYREDGE